MHTMHGKSPGPSDRIAPPKTPTEKGVLRQAIYSLARSSLAGIARAAGDSERAAEDMGLILKPSPASAAGALACLGLASSATVLHADAANSALSTSAASGVTPGRVCIEAAACSDVGAWPLSGAAARAET